MADIERGTTISSKDVYEFPGLVPCSLGGGTFALPWTLHGGGEMLVEKCVGRCLMRRVMRCLVRCLDEMFG